MNLDLKANKEEFLQLLRSTERDGIEDVISDLEQLGFFEAPASAGHHLNIEGGLVKHSINTCKAALAIWEAMKPREPSLESEVKRDSVIIASLLHDVCKSDIYKRSVKKRKNALGQWEDCEGYKVTYKEFPMGHGEKSVVLLLCSGLDLSDAEMLAITQASAAIGDWRLTDCTLYVTKEPCAMCAGAMVNARLGACVFACPDPRMGAAGSALDVTAFPGMLHTVHVQSGLLADEARTLLQTFFRNRRRGVANPHSHPPHPNGNPCDCLG